MAYEDLSGKKFDMLTVIGPTGRRSHGYIEYHCICDCGNEVDKGSNLLRKDNKHSCGCHKLKNKAVPGKKYNYLTMIRDLPESRMALFRCDCGSERVISHYSVVTGRTISCGECQYHFKHMSETHSTHGKSNSKFYELYKGIIKRCYYPKAINYYLYGGRGITVCDEWRDSFQAFYDWSMANGYEPGLSIDRIDNDGPYSPENCRWVSLDVQANNKRTSHYLTYNGETKTVSQWAHERGMLKETLFERLKKGWSIEDALTKPVQQYRRSNGSD